MRRGDSTKESALEDGYASEADWLGNIEGESVGEGDGVGSGSGCWIEREGRERLRILAVFLWGEGLAHRRTFKETE